MIHALKPVPAHTQRILTTAICAGLMVLLGSAVVLDEETEFGPTVDHLFSLLFALNLGPVLMLAGLVGLVRAWQPHDKKLVPLALAFMVFGAFITWLFFIETNELPDIWPG